MSKIWTAQTQDYVALTAALMFVRDHLPPVRDQKQGQVKEDFREEENSWGIEENIQEEPNIIFNKNSYFWGLMTLYKTISLFANNFEN